MKEQGLGDRFWFVPSMLGDLDIRRRGKPLGPGVDLAAVARSTAGFSGADLANVVNEAALLATRRSSPSIETADLSEALERVVSGPSRRSRVLTADDADGSQSTRPATPWWPPCSRRLRRS